MRAHAQEGPRRERSDLMDRRLIVVCKSTPEGLFIPCPVCRSGKLMRLYPETRAEAVSLYCRKCKRESVVDISAGGGLDRVILRRIC